MSIFIEIHAVHTRRQLGSLDEKKQEVVFSFLSKNLLFKFVIS
jgi:hypothetical protein